MDKGNCESEIEVTKGASKEARKLNINVSPGL
jgi:hypothetical protein